MSTLTTYLTEIADALREKKETEGVIAAQDYAEEIKSISEIGTMKFIDNDGNVHRVLSVASTEKPVPISTANLESSFYHFIAHQASDGNIVAGCITSYPRLEIYKYSSDFSQILGSIKFSAETFSRLYGSIILLNNNDIVMSDGLSYTKYINYESFEVVWSLEEGGALEEYGDSFLFCSGTTGIKIFNSSGNETGTWSNITQNIKYFCRYNNYFYFPKLSGLIYLYKYNKDGTKLWEVLLKATYSSASNVSGVDKIGVMEDGRIVVRTKHDSNYDATVQIINPSDGSLIQRITTGADYVDFFIDGTNLLVSNNSGSASTEGVTKYNASGTEIWFYPITFRGSIQQYPLSAGEVIDIFDDAYVYQISQEIGYETGTVIEMEV